MANIQKQEVLVTLKPDYTELIKAYQNMADWYAKQAAYMQEKMREKTERQYEDE